MSFSSDGSDAEGRVHGYQPVGVGDRLRPANSEDFVYATSTKSTPVKAWPGESVSVYTNDLFTDADAEEHAQAKPPPVKAAPKSTLAARRAERLQAGMYQSNQNNIARTPGTPTARPPAPTTFEDSPSIQNQHSSGTPSGSLYGLKSTYDPEEEGNRGLGNPRGMPAAALDLSDLGAFLMQPGPRDGPPIMCHIIRDKGSAKMYPRYTLYLEDPKMFLMAARKRKKQTTSNYLVSLDPEDLNRESSKFYGKVRANFVGTEFTMFDGGDKPKTKSVGGHASFGGANNQGLRQELGAITYQYNVLGTRGPRKMTAVIPSLDNAGNSLYNPTNESDGLLERLRLNKSLHELVIMHNKPPRWNDELNAYCLNFNGRVTEASVKNFQLVTDDNQNHVILQFGKVGKNMFTMDYMWPMSAFQAFSICLSSFDNKLACE